MPSLEHKTGTLKQDYTTLENKLRDTPIPKLPQDLDVQSELEFVAKETATTEEVVWEKWVKRDREQATKDWTINGIPADAANMLHAKIQDVMRENILTIKPVVTFREYMQRRHSSDPARFDFIMRRSNANTVVQLDELGAKFNAQLPNISVEAAQEYIKAAYRLVKGEELEL